MTQMEPHKRASTKTQIKRKTLILEGYKLVEKVHAIFVNKYQLYKYLSPDDLADMKQDCVVEMIKAVDRYDSKRGVKLTTYLNPRLQGFFKDQLKKQAKARALRQTDYLDITLDFVCCEIDEVLSLNREQATIRLDQLNISNDVIQDILLDISDNSDSYEIFDSLASLPDTRIYIILGYYVMNKSIKELSKELGFSPDTGWVYRMKREGIVKLQSLLIDKRILKEETQ